METPSPADRLGPEIRESLESAPRPVSEEKRIPLPAAEGAEQPLGKAEALTQAEELCRIVLDQLCRYLRPLEKARKIPEELLPLGLSAGAAGLLQVLCGYRELRSHPLSPKLMADCAGRLLAAKTLKTASGRLLWDTLDLGRPVSGMGHGTAGIGASLRMAGVLLHREECLLAAGEALDWEYQAYSERLGAWPDFRESSLGEHAMHGYCSGAPGMGLAMLLYGEWGESGPLQRENLSRAFDACRRLPPHPLAEEGLLVVQQLLLGLVEVSDLLEIGHALAQKAGFAQAVVAARVIGIQGQPFFVAGDGGPG